LTEPSTFLDTEDILIRLTSVQVRIVHLLLKILHPATTKEIERTIHTDYLIYYSFVEHPKKIDMSKEEEKIRKMAANERLRIKSVAVLNKKYGANIPSYRKVESELYRLKELGLVELIEYKTPKARLQSNGYWVLDPLFYQKWLKRKAEIATDLHEKGLAYIKNAYPPKTLKFYNLDRVM
jgi:hypothetical protein